MSDGMCDRTADYAGNDPTAVVQAYAPHLFFEVGEADFPADPDLMRGNGRFRWSNYRGNDDYGWDKDRAEWVKGNDHARRFHGASWEAIVGQTRTAHGLPPQQPIRDPCGQVTRPHDYRNLWGAKSPRGLFLELREGYARNGSGRPESGGGVFYDLFVIQPSRCTVLAYWFFYLYNWHVPGFGHEGDWEHVSLVFPGANLNPAQPPKWVFYAQHGGGQRADYEKEVEKTDLTHPCVYASMWGHASYAALPHGWRKDWSRSRRTWDTAIPALRPLQAWSEYDGAWGEVGPWVHSTGPLGPWFKRGADQAIFERCP